MGTLVTDHLFSIIKSVGNCGWTQLNLAHIQIKNKFLLSESGVFLGLLDISPEMYASFLFVNLNVGFLGPIFIIWTLSMVISLLTPVMYFVTTKRKVFRRNSTQDAIFLT